MPVATPTLTIADNANGTGAVATIAGATAGTTNTVYCAAWDGGFIGAVFASYGSRTSSGTVALAVANGYWWAYVVSTDGATTAVSLVSGFRATAETLAMFEQAANGVKALISGLSLATFDPTHIITAKLPWDQAFSWAVPKTPAIIVNVLADSNKLINTGQNEWQFDILVTIWRASNDNLIAPDGNHLLWRQQIASAFLPAAGRAALPGVTEVHNVEVLTGPVYEVGMFKSGYDCEQLTIRCYYRRNRGLT